MSAAQSKFKAVMPGASVGVRAMLQAGRRWTVAGFVLLFGLIAGGEASAGRMRLTDWSTIQNDRFGFLLAYPGSIFTPREGPSPDEGHVLISRDGNARLAVAAFENESEATLEEYREQLLTENYNGAQIDYAPVKKKWFVVSGTRGGMHFYERVSFTCGGKLINSWVLLYPAAERRLYDRVVEAIADSYMPGAGRSGECD
jgi:hypothetical protein